MTLTPLGAAKNGGKELVKTTAKEGAEFVSENVAKTTAKEVAKTTGETLTENIAKTTAKESTEALGEKVAKESAKDATKDGAESAAKTAVKTADDVAKNVAKTAGETTETITKTATKTEAKETSQTLTKSATEVKNGGKETGEVATKTTSNVASKTDESEVFDKIKDVAQQAYDYAVENPRKTGLNRMQLGKDAEIQATRWTRKWAERNGIDLSQNGLHFQVRGENSIPDAVYEPTKSIMDFKLTPKAVRKKQSDNFKNDFPDYSIDYIFGPGSWR